MLIYARIILFLILLTSIFQIIGGLGSFAQGWVWGGAFMLVWGSVFAWLAWTNWTDAARCADVLDR